MSALREALSAEDLDHRLNFLADLQRKLPFDARALLDMRPKFGLLA
jgi:hypothetical protein